MNQLVNNDFSLNVHDFFTFVDGINKGKKLKVIATESNGDHVYNCIDTIRNLENDNIITIQRKKLKELNPVFYYKPVSYKIERKKSKKK